jgi:DNA-binding transcriptional regulator YiaG
MSIALTRRERQRNAETRLQSPEQPNTIASQESNERIILSDLIRFVVDSDLSIPHIAELLQVSDVTLSMWIAGTAKPSTIKLREIGSFLQSR